MLKNAAYIGENQLDALIDVKSKEELIGGIIAMLQSPVKNVISALQSGGQTIAWRIENIGRAQRIRIIIK